MIKVCHIISSLDPKTGGPARSVPILSHELHKAGLNVSLFVSELQKNESTNIDHIPIRHIDELRNVANKSASLDSKLIIHNHGIWLPVNHESTVVARKYAIPYIISPRGMLEPWALDYNKWKKKLAWFLYQSRDLHHAQLIHATAPQEAKNIRMLGIRNPIAVIPNGVYLPQNFQRSIIRKEIKTALFLSRIHPKKGLINLIRAWKKIAPLNWQVKIVGADEENHKKEVEYEINKLDLSNIFSFFGEVTDQDKWEVYQQADLFILPSFSENFGIVIAEALASGLPVIATKGTPWPELQKNTCGWWVDLGVDPLAKAIAEATSLPQETLIDMGRRGRSLVSDRYSWKKNAQDMVRVYNWILFGGKKPDCVELPTNNIR